LRARWDDEGGHRRALNRQMDPYVARLGECACGAMIRPKGMTACFRCAVSDARNTL
jgi:hypothetical protein